MRLRRMKAAATVGLMLMMVALAGSASAAPITYNLNVTAGDGSATGTITTDGTIGVIGTANLVDWNILLNDGLTTFSLLGPLSGNNSQGGVQGVDFVGSPTQLTFDFSGPGFVLFQNPTWGTGINFLCFDGGGGCASQPNSIVIATTTYASDISLQRGVTVVATAGTTSAPEPGVLLLAGVGMFVTATRRFRLRRG